MTANVTASPLRAAPTLEIRNDLPPLNDQKFLERPLFFSKSCSFIYMLFLSLYEPLKRESTERFNKKREPQEDETPLSFGPAFVETMAPTLSELLGFFTSLKTIDFETAGKEAIESLIAQSPSISNAWTRVKERFGKTFVNSCIDLLANPFYANALYQFHDSSDTADPLILKSNLYHAITLYSNILGGICASGTKIYSITGSPLNGLLPIAYDHFKTSYPDYSYTNYLIENLDSIFYKLSAPLCHHHWLLEQLTEALFSCCGGRPSDRRGFEDSFSGYFDPSFSDETIDSAAKIIDGPFFEAHFEDAKRLHTELLKDLSQFTDYLEIWNRFFYFFISETPDNINQKFSEIFPLSPKINTKKAGELFSNFSTEKFCSAIKEKIPFPQYVAIPPSFIPHVELFARYDDFAKYIEDHLHAIEFIFDNAVHLFEKIQTKQKKTKPLRQIQKGKGKNSKKKREPCKPLEKKPADPFVPIFEEIIQLNDTPPLLEPLPIKRQLFDLFLKRFGDHALVERVYQRYPAYLRNLLLLAQRAQTSDSPDHLFHILLCTLEQTNWGLESLSLAFKVNDLRIITSKTIRNLEIHDIDFSHEHLDEQLVQFIKQINCVEFKCRNPLQAKEEGLDPFNASTEELPSIIDQLVKNYIRSGAMLLQRELPEGWDECLSKAELPRGRLTVNHLIPLVKSLRVTEGTHFTINRLLAELELFKGANSSEIDQFNTTIRNLLYHLANSYLLERLGETNRQFEYLDLLERVELPKELRRFIEGLNKSRYEIRYGLKQRTHVDKTLAVNLAKKDLILTDPLPEEDLFKVEAKKTLSRCRRVLNHLERDLKLFHQFAWHLTR